MSVTLLRGKDEFRRQKFWKKIADQGYQKQLFTGSAKDLMGSLTTPHLFGQAIYVIEDQDLISEITDFLMYNKLAHPLIIDQGDKSDPCYRRLSRKFEIVYCEPILGYKRDEIVQWIYEVATEVGVPVYQADIDSIIENLGEESQEIYRVLELSKLTGEPISTLVQYDTKKALLVLLDSLPRHEFELAVKTLVFLEKSGIEFIQVAHALLTRYELLLKIKCSQQLGLEDKDLRKQLRIPNIIASNVISEARMNTFDWICKFMKNLTMNATSQVGYHWLILTLIVMNSSQNHN